MPACTIVRMDGLCHRCGKPVEPRPRVIGRGHVLWTNPPTLLCPACCCQGPGLFSELEDTAYREAEKPAEQRSLF